jgi:hypothetical protein
MKILLLITGLFFSSGLFADMDYICKSDSNSSTRFIAEKCERNNILIIRAIPVDFVDDRIAMWCRHDRQISFVPNGKYVSLTCVLYDNKPRKYLEYS